MRLWFERGFKAKPVGYELQKMFTPHAFLGYPGRASEQIEKQANDMQLLSKFYRKYPEVKYMPQATRMNVGFGNVVEVTHPAAVFVKKQRDLMKKGYTEIKAFENVEEELGKTLNQQKEELRILRGLAINTFGSQSYSDRFQQIAELESSLKVKRLERDMPKYLRSQEDWKKELEKQDVEELGEDRSFERQSIEDLLNYEAQTAFKDRDLVK